ncbi:MAG TPA: ribonuclease HII [Holosporales bacterium]|nr:ribonuclease HII [Holosporales bacterium]
MITIKYKPSFDLENSYNGDFIAGIDEAGCGPWAGPLVAAACILDQTKISQNLLVHINDSKTLSIKKREAIYEKLIQDDSVLYSVYIMDITEFNKLGLAKALPLTIGRAVANLRTKPKHILMDGIRDPKVGIPTSLIIKGDQKSYSIAAASIIAKVTRDRLMQQLSIIHPEYNWGKNAGYGTKDHQKALETYGVTPYHRTCYKPIQKLLLNA